MLLIISKPCQRTLSEEMNKTFGNSHNTAGRQILNAELLPVYGSAEFQLQYLHTSPFLRNITFLCSHYLQLILKKSIFPDNTILD